jgi:hypothetical protein
VNVGVLLDGVLLMVGRGRVGRMIVWEKEGGIVVESSGWSRGVIVV